MNSIYVQVVYNFCFINTEYLKTKIYTMKYPIQQYVSLSTVQ